jgi:hypothetical protein
VEPSWTKHPVLFVLESEEVMNDEQFLSIPSPLVAWDDHTNKYQELRELKGEYVLCALRLGNLETRIKKLLPFAPRTRVEHMHACPKDIVVITTIPENAAKQAGIKHVVSFVQREITKHLSRYLVGSWRNEN